MHLLGRQAEGSMAWATALPSGSSSGMRLS